jgi:putative ABC transport system permease protein
MGIPVILGRSLSEQDRWDGPKEALINQSMARRYFHDQDPIGQRISLGLPQSPVWLMTIVGVVADFKQEAMEKEFYPAIIMPLTWPAATLVVRARDNPLNLVAAIRGKIRSIDRDILVYNIRTMDQALGATLEERRFTMFLLSIFAAVALALAAVGLYGVMSYMVSQRSHEIGIRMALGARRSDVLMMVVGEGVKLAGSGVLIGLGGALALTRLMKTLVFGVSATDPLTFTAIALSLTLVALLAALVPARRATKVDPIIALRCE